MLEINIFRPEIIPHFPAFLSFSAFIFFIPNKAAALGQYLEKYAHTHTACVKGAQARRFISPPSYSKNNTENHIIKDLDT